MQISCSYIINNSRIFIESQRNTTVCFRSNRIASESSRVESNKLNVNMCRVRCCARSLNHVEGFRNLLLAPPFQKMMDANRTTPLEGWFLIRSRYSPPVLVIHKNPIRPKANFIQCLLFAKRTHLRLADLVFSERQTINICTALNNVTPKKIQIQTQWRIGILGA